MTNTPRPEDSHLEQLRHIASQVLSLRQEMDRRERAAAAVVTGLDPRRRASAINLAHYLALRSQDLRDLQDDLAELGLSSLGRCEPAVRASLDAVFDLLRWSGAVVADETPPPPVRSISEGRRELDRRTEELLGTPSKGREVRIMVTMPSEAAEYYSLVRDLLQGGMNCMRINCAHDGPEQWDRMISHLARAREELGLPCLVAMDLAGPKLRTGELPPGPEVIKIRPRRDQAGLVLQPAQLWLTNQVAPRAASLPTATVPVPGDFLSSLQAGDQIRLRDARGSNRILLITQQGEGGCWATCQRTVYLATGTVLYRRRDRARCQIGKLPPCESAIQLRHGDRLTLTRDPSASNVEARRIPCTLPEVFADVKPGEPIWLDDGKIGGKVEAVTADELVIEITQAAREGSKLRADKGINLPRSDLSVPCLTAEDLENLPFVVAHADMVGYSFVRRVEDVLTLQQHLARLGGEHLGIVLKIETVKAFSNLPALLLAAMSSRRAGVMIARGDLAVEAGWERLAEVQEEILWLCEAAHVPVIWATQVLESLAKTGQPSRAEITDAAMGERAECVMLNKGQHIVAAVRVLDDILKRMQEHQRKKRPMLRLLRVAVDTFRLSEG